MEEEEVGGKEEEQEEDNRTFSVQPTRVLLH